MVPSSECLKWEWKEKMGLESNLCDRVILKMGGKNVVRLWAVLGVNDDNL